MSTTDIIKGCSYYSCSMIYKLVTSYIACIYVSIAYNYIYNTYNYSFFDRYGKYICIKDQVLAKMKLFCVKIRESIYAAVLRKTIWRRKERKKEISKPTKKERKNEIGIFIETVNLTTLIILLSVEILKEQAKHLQKLTKWPYSKFWWVLCYKWWACQQHPYMESLPTLW